MKNIASIKSRELKISLNIPVNKTYKFWEGLKEGKIYATKCVKCKKLHFPPVTDCGECLSSKVEWVELTNQAQIETFTNVAIKPVSFSTSQSYTVAVGKLKEGIKVLAWLNGFEQSQIKIGLKVKLVTKISSEGNLSYEFVPLG